MAAAGLAVALALAGMGGDARATGCRSTGFRVAETPSTFLVGPFRVVLLGADQPASPTAWEGPIRIENRQTGAVCEVAPLDLVERPLAAFDETRLTLVTFSGSNYRIATLNLAQCAIEHRTPRLTGPIVLRTDRVYAGAAAIDGVPCLGRER